MFFLGSSFRRMNYSSDENDYDHDYEDEVCEKEMVVKFGSIAIPVFFSVVIILSIIGNILVLVILALYENVKSLTNIFILNLAISDLVFTTGLPFWAIYHIWGWLFSEILCKIVTFVFFIGFYSSILFLTIMTIYRYMAVVHPLSDMSAEKLMTGIFLSILLWMISVGAALPSLLYSSLIPIPHKGNHSQGCAYESDLWESISAYQQNIFFVVAFIVMAFCYIRILVTLRKTRSHTKNRAVKLIFSIVTVFFVGWVPYNVTIFLKILGRSLVAPFDNCESIINLDYAFYVCRLLAFSHCCLNPVFYVFVGVKFRRHLKSVLFRMCVYRTSVSSTPAEQQMKMQNFSHGSMF